MLLVTTIGKILVAPVVCWLCNSQYGLGGFAFLFMGSNEGIEFFEIYFCFVVLVFQVFIEWAGIRNY